MDEKIDLTLNEQQRSKVVADLTRLLNILVDVHRNDVIQKAVASKWADLEKDNFKQPFVVPLHFLFAAPSWRKYIMDIKADRIACVPSPTVYGDFEAPVEESRPAWYDKLPSLIQRLFDGRGSDNVVSYAEKFVHLTTDMGDKVSTVEVFDLRFDTVLGADVLVYINSNIHVEGKKKLHY